MALSSSKEKALLNRAVGAVKKGNKREAVALFKEVLKINPMNVQAWLGLAWALDEEDKKEFCLKKALAIEPNNRHAIEMLQGLKGRKWSTQANPSTHSGSGRTRSPSRGMVATGGNNKVETLQKPVTCFYHLQEPAVSQCPRCGKFLCKTCAKGLGGLCVDCATEVVEEGKARLKEEVTKTFVPIVIFALLGALFGFVQPNDSAAEKIGTALVGMYMFAGVPVGWKGVSVVFKGAKATSFEGLYWLYAIKFFIAMIVGLFLQPFVLVYWVIKFRKRAKALARQSQQVQRMRALLSKRFVVA